MGHFNDLRTRSIRRVARSDPWESELVQHCGCPVDGPNNDQMYPVPIGYHRVGLAKVACGGISPRDLRPENAKWKIGGSVERGGINMRANLRV